MSTAQPKRQGEGAGASTSTFLDPYDPLFPSSDGKPMAESTTQFRWIVTIKEGLEALFADRDDIFVAGDLLWYVDRTNPADVMAPDAMVVFGRPKGERRSYRAWVEDEVVPQVVFEVASYTNTPAEMAEKRRRYDARGVEEYYFYDPESGDFEGWLRRPNGLWAIDADGWTSPRLGVTFEAPRRKEALVIRRPDGEPFRTFGELARDEEAARRIAEAEARRRRKAVRLARAERKRADEATRWARAERQLREETAARVDLERRLREETAARADMERRLREEAEARAARLEARLRELGEASE